MPDDPDESAEGVCSVCGDRTVQFSITYPIAMVEPMPRQAEPNVRITTWQCVRHEDHHGEFQRPAE